MTCSSCGYELAPEFVFCPKCGARNANAAAVVPNIAGAVAVDPTFSPAQLGKPRRRAGPNISNHEANRRQVTVLFADLSGFTRLSERLDPEEIRSFQNALFESLGKVIARYGGYVAKFLGDAVLALFGAPVAHEDDPERSLNAALGILALCTPLSHQWASRLGQPVSLHIAVHTGPVVAGSFSDAAGAAYDVTGDTVNTASRLLGAAAPGTILVSEATRSLTRHRFSFEPAGELALRGKAEPMVVHRLLRALADPQSARGLASYGLTSPLVGRTEELARLDAAYERMQHGRTQVVTIGGEAGTGKSRLIVEFLERIAADRRMDGVAIRRVGCSSLGEPTYGVFAMLFREGYQVALDDSLAVAEEKLTAGLKTLGAEADVVKTVAPVLRYLLGAEQANVSDLDPEQLARQIALAARLLVDRRLARGPLLIVVEDAHWADAASLELLADIASHLAERQLMLMISHRPEARPLLTSRAERTAFTLEPLSADDTWKFVGELLGVADPVVLDFIAGRAGGNPLFVEEIVRNLVATGAIARQGDRWTCAGDFSAVNIPPTLHGLLLSRLDRLPAESRRVLQEAAVLGVSFDEALLTSVSTNPQSIGTALHHLAEADLIDREGSTPEARRYRFTHALVHETVYENLLVSRRAELHERAGRALEQACGTRPPRLSDLEALGHHWSLAPDKAKGARYLTAAGDWARGMYANEDAIRHYEHALRTLAGCSDCDDQLHAVRERLADLLTLAGRRTEALAHYEAVRQQLAVCSDSTGSARLSRKIGSLLWDAGDREGAEACFASGLERLGDSGSPAERAYLFQEMGRLAFRIGDNAGAIRWAERALAEVAGGEATSPNVERSREIAVARAQASNTLGVALARTGRLAEAVANIEQSIELAEDHDLLQAACRGYTNLGVLYSSLNPRRSIETCLKGLETAKKVGDLGFQSRLYANLAVAYCALTDRCEAEGMEAAQRAIDLDRRLGLLDHLAVPLIVLGQIHQCHGNHALARASYEEALILAEQSGDPQLLFPCYDGLATLNLDVGNVQFAEGYLAKSQAVCERAGLDPDAFLVLPFLC
jgi:adenylate cyclase